MTYRSVAFFKASLSPTASQLDCEGFTRGWRIFIPLSLTAAFESILTGSFDTVNRINCP